MKNGENGSARRLTRRETIVAGGIGAAAIGGVAIDRLGSDDAPQLTARQEEALALRTESARADIVRPAPDQPSNGDEARYPDRFGNHSKGLPHDTHGRVEPAAYEALVAAIEDRAPFEDVPVAGGRRLVNPRAGRAFGLAGRDPQSFELGPPPAVSSPGLAADLVELYWLALARDVAFSRYAEDELTVAAVLDLSNREGFRGPSVGGRVDPGLLFRGSIPGQAEGPYVSQFLLTDIPAGAAAITQRYIVPIAGDDHATGLAEWLRIQRGFEPRRQQRTDPRHRYVRNARDLAEVVHRDYPYQIALGASLILLQFGPDAVDPGNPYLDSSVEEGFTTLGGPQAVDLVARVAYDALCACWHQKWFVHRTARPEEIAGRLDADLRRSSSSELHPSLLSSAVVERIAERQGGSVVLPQAYPEACPLHPSYPSGHASFIGASVTVLKAFFDESFALPDPVVASDDGTRLEPYAGPPLTVGAELDKLAANVALGRCSAGIHWRFDAEDGIRLGEEVALAVLADVVGTLPEQDVSFTLRGFDGSPVTVTRDGLA